MYANATQAFLGELRAIVDEGRPIHVRGSAIMETLSRHIVIEIPQDRVCVIPDRRNNIFATIAETLWVLGGRNDVQYLSRYLPRAVRFSDDGLTWRAGYGPRLRDWHGVDQIKEVARILGEESASRRAAIVLFDPAQDFMGSKDIPCNNWLHFLLRDRHLHLNVAIRSNDIMWGFSGINTFEWSVLQEAMAFWTGAGMGPASYLIGSLHMYDRHVERARRILKHQRVLTPYDFGLYSPRFGTPLAQFDDVLGLCFEVEERVRRGDTSVTLEIGRIPDEFLRASLAMLYIYNRHLHGADSGEIGELIQELPMSDFRVAAIEYFTRGGRGQMHISLRPEETEFFAKFGEQGVQSL